MSALSKLTISACLCAAAALTGLAARAHHSFAMYDRSKTYVLTGVVTNLNPDPSHLQVLFVPLNDERSALVRDHEGERVVWAVDMEGAAAAARLGITASNFTRGTVISIAANPLRNGQPGGTRVGPIYRCPQGSAPQPGMHCNSVDGAEQHGEGELPASDDVWTPEQ